MLPVWRRWPRILLRDSRMAAAIPLGPRALTPEVSSRQAFAWATAVHVLVALSDALVISLLSERRIFRKCFRLAPSIFGALYGLAAYGFRFYVLAPLFYPWFCKLRTPAYLLTHIAHGVFTMLAWKRYKRGNTISRCAMIF